MKVNLKKETRNLQRINKRKKRKQKKQRNDGMKEKLKINKCSIKQKLNISTNDIINEGKTMNEKKKHK